MEKITIQHKKKKISYPIYIGNGILSILKKNETVQSASSIVIITDSHVSKHWLVPLEKILGNKKIISIIIDPGEINKSINTLQIIWKKMLKDGADRLSLVVTLGGGVVCDVGGFVAGTFMRGISVIHIPTTLLAQVDASVGGKTAVDFCDIKNSIGMFYQPSGVIIDVQTLCTLPQRQITAGFAELLKHAIIADKDLFNSLSKKKINGISSEEWVQTISQSVRIKKSIVEQDEEEKNGIRKQLNFGHTIGHAIEALSLITKNPLLHGEAVAIGMVAETRMSRLAGYISQEDETAIISVLSLSGLPTKVSDISIPQIQKMILTDKKNKGGNILWSLPFCIGKVKSDCVLNPKIIKQGIEMIIK